MSEPTTPTGKRLLEANGTGTVMEGVMWDDQPIVMGTVDELLAIEREAAAQERERQGVRLEQAIAYVQSSMGRPLNDAQIRHLLLALRQHDERVR